LLGGGASALAASGGGGLGGHKHKRKHHRRRHHGQAQVNPLSQRGIWIWELPSSNGGNLGSIIAQAHRHSISTLIIKSGDGSNYWSQFNGHLISTLHAHGLHACAWQFVYGSQPGAEAKVGAQAVKTGADCLMIDAEGDYEGRYVQAQTYIRQLRGMIGSRFPLALAGFPYVDYHEAFPYSVFLGPGGAQYNAPQMYWYVIGTSPDGVYSHTYEYNRIYQRAIFPIGEAVADGSAGAPPASQVRRFRLMARAYHAANASWWVWQGLPSANWNALSQHIDSLSGYRANNTYASLGQGARGDLVIWAQEHLVSAGENVSVDGSFGPKTKAAVKRFQSAHRLPSIGVIGPATWSALLRYSPKRVTWTTRHGKLRTAAASRDLVPVPSSARLPAKRNEIPPWLGAGRPR
jgi:Putative peptidoglycan binding domain